MSSGRDEPVATVKGRTHFAVRVTCTNRLTDNTVEIRFERPKGFDFLAGQKIGVMHDDLYRDYSLISPRQGSDLAICVRKITDGALSPILAGAKTGDRYLITPAFGYFLYQPSSHPAVFVATGTGIAPFAAFAHDGAKNYLLLHGVRSEAELYYRDLLASAAKRYTPCISGDKEQSNGGRANFYGRVTDFLETQLPQATYDFYLCGRSEMIRDATHLIDEKFSGSLIYTEQYY